MEHVVQLFLTQLITLSPMLLAYVVGAILALLFWRRCPRPSTLTLLAMMLLLITTLVQSFLVSYLISQAQADFDWSHEKLGFIMAATGLIGTLLRGAALGLLLTAVFIGRTAPHEPRAKETPPLTVPASRQPEEHGITSRPGS